MSVWVCLQVPVSVYIRQLTVLKSRSECQTKKGILDMLFDTKRHLLSIFLCDENILTPNSVWPEVVMTAMKHLHCLNKRKKEKSEYIHMDSPDKLGLHWVIEWHEHLCILADLTHHILQSHKEGKCWCRGKLCLSAQINILLLRLSEGKRGIVFNIRVFFHSFLSGQGEDPACEDKDTLRRSG